MQFELLPSGSVKLTSTFASSKDEKKVRISTKKV